MYFIELQVNQGSETLTSTDRGFAPRLRAHASRHFPDARFWTVSKVESVLDFHPILPLSARDLRPVRSWQSRFRGGFEFRL
jgi:hypothetical protein